MTHTCPKCPECKGTGLYVGFGLYPAEKCKFCQGTGKAVDSNCGSCGCVGEANEECCCGNEGENPFVDPWTDD